MKREISALPSTVEIIAKANSAQFHLLPDPSDCRLSQRTLWEDSVWHLDGNQASIHWAFEMHDGTCFTDGNHANLLDYFKRFVWSMLVDVRDGRAWTAHAMATRAVGIKRLARWMVRRSHFDFSTLDADALEQFKEDVLVDLQTEDIQIDDAALLTAITETDDEDLEDFSEVATDEVSFASALNRAFQIWHRLWRQSPSLEVAGIPIMVVDPLAGRSARALVLELTTWAVKRIPPLPDEVALPVLNEVHSWLDVRADDVIRLHELYMRILGEKDETGGLANIDDDQAAELKEFKFSVIFGASEPWHQPISPTKVVYGTSGSHYRVPTDTVRELVDRIAAACAIVIQSETGMRISELANIPAGFSVEENGHNALVVRLSKTGLNELYFIRSTLQKTVRAPKVEEWLAGSRPVGSSFVPGPVRAVQVLEALYAPWRRVSDDPAVHKALFVASQAGGHLTTKSNALMPSKTYTLRILQRWFIEKYVDLSEIPNKSRLGEDLISYRESKGVCIKPHQWRKTFAMYVVRTNPNMIPAIALQFKHLSVAMTETAYTSKDPTLMREHSAQQARAAAAFMYRAVTGKDVVAGRITKLIDEWSEEIRARIDKMDAVTAIDTLQDMCEERDIRVFSSPHGECFLRLQPTEARCHQEAGTAHWGHKKPNFDRREPDVCNGCACFGVDSAHVPFWKDRYVENQTAWNTAQRLGLKAGFRVVQERATQSANMLRALRIELPTVQVEE